ncbi:MAG: phytanoyl-CoA dioxygenase family protein [Proteobacteria bacterium]|nr:phytanoyl-CoA dioxygenase family protein [Pseudomonadota bacterium]
MTDYPISQQQIDQYEADGVLLLKGVFSEEWIEKMRIAVDEVLNNPGPQSMDINDEGDGRFTFDTWIWTYNDRFRDVVFSSPWAGLAAKILNAKRVNLVFDFISVKEPHTSQPAVWHQDAPGNPVEGPQAGTFWVSLDHVTAESGAVRYVRSSHKWGRSFEPVGSNNVYEHDLYAGRAPDSQQPPGVEEMPDIDAIVDPADIFSFETDPGDVIVHDVLTIHSSPGNHSDRRRRALGLRFAGERATYAVRETKLNIRPLADPLLKHGDHFPAEPDHHVFPQVWPNAA